MTNAVLPRNLDDAATELPDEAHGLYKHKKRPQWGLAIVAWERGDKRGYQFEDGKLRVFKKGFYSLFEEVDPPEDAAIDLVDELNRRLATSIKHAKRKASGNKLKPVYPFETQAEIFRRQFAEGFQDPAWKEDKRGEDASRRLKRHRDAAIEEAQKDFNQESFKALLDEGRYTEVWERAIEHLEGTTLLNRSHIEPLKVLREDQHQEFAEAFYDLLWGDGKFVRRFERYMEALTGGKPDDASWQLATALPALVRPTKHVCVRPSTFKKQAGAIAPSLIYTKNPSPRSYRNYRKMAKATRRKLKGEGFEPKDLMDIHDFIWCTLRPAAKKYLD